MLLLSAILVICLANVLELREQRIKASNLLNSSNGAKTYLLERLNETQKQLIEVNKRLIADEKIQNAIDKADDQSFAQAAKELATNSKFQTVLLTKDLQPPFDKCSGIKQAVKAKGTLQGVFSNAQKRTLSIISLSPCGSGFCAIYQPIDNDFLKSLKTDAARANPKFDQLDFVLYSPQTAQSLASSQEPYSPSTIDLPIDYPDKEIKKLTGKAWLDELIAPGRGFQRKDRWSQDVRLTDVERELVGIIVISTPLETKSSAQKSEN